MPAVVIGLGGFVEHASVGSRASTTQAAENPPFALSSALHPVAVSQANVCTLVTITDTPTYVQREVKGSDGRDITERFLEFNVEVVTSSEPKTTQRFRCVSRSTTPTDTPGAHHRYLLIGWTGSQSGRLSIEPKTVREVVVGVNVQSIEGGPDSLMVLALYPTAQRNVASSADPVARAYLNLTDAATHEAPEPVIRGFSSALARITPTYRDTNIEQLQAYSWLQTRIGSRLGAVPSKTPVERLRFGGLLANWDREKRALPYLRELPNLMKELALIEKPRGNREAVDDLQFLASLDLVTGVDPDSVLAIAFSNPCLKFIALDSRLGKPSLDSQRKFLGWVDDPDPEVRSHALCRFAAWYGEFDKMTQASYSPTSKTMVVDRDEELRAYWRNKIGEPAKP